MVGESPRRWYFTQRHVVGCFIPVHGGVIDAPVSRHVIHVHDQTEKDITCTFRVITKNVSQ